VTELREQVALKKNLESLGEMSAGLAHEFKNAVAALQGYVQFLQSRDLDEKSATAAASLLNEVRSLSGMVTSFLNFARPQPLQLEEVSLKELLDDCVTELQALLNELNVTLLLNVPDHVIVSADERMLRQALLNLLRNGAEAITDDQTDRRMIVQSTIEKDTKPAWTTISIRDTGPGIPATDLQGVHSFFTTSPRAIGWFGLAHQ
jgi:signal transduction histidine kinase